MWVGNTVNIHDRLMYSPYNEVMSTRQGSIPFAPFAGGSDTLVAAAVLTMHSSSCTVVWVNITSPKNSKLS